MKSNTNKINNHNKKQKNMSTKIKKISIKNIKAISETVADFNGCTAIITAGNNKGKSTLLNSIQDRIRGEKPSMIVKDGEENGIGILELTTGERFEWQVSKDGKEKLNFYTKDNIKVAVTKEISKRFFPSIFDVDEFLNSQPKQQVAQLQKLVGIDFTDIDAQYKTAYDDRTVANKEVTLLENKVSAMGIVEKVESVEVATLIAEKEAERVRLNKLYLANKKHNDDLRTQYNADLSKAKEDFENEKNDAEQKDNVIASAKSNLIIIQSYGYTGKEVQKWIDSLPVGAEVILKDVKEPEYITELPEDTELQAIDAKINTASETNQKADNYKRYTDLKTELENAKATAETADARVKQLEADKKEMIAGANLPTGITIENDGILTDGFPLDKSQISSSKLYCTALKLASMNLGEVKTIHFDASTLDKNTLLEIETWANENDLQLLIERPDFDGGEIKYEIVNG